MHFPGFHAKNSYDQYFRDVSFKKQLQQPPGESMLLKSYQNVSNREKIKVTSLKVLGVLE